MDVEYSKTNKRMKYNNEFHDKHGQPWTVQELSYLCKMYSSMKKEDLSMALGRTHSTVLNKAYDLKRKGQFDYYKDLDI